VNDAIVDVRGPRFAAWVTTAVLAVVLITSSAVLLGVQAVVFALGAVLGLRAAPYGWLFRTVVAPRLGPPTEFEAEAPPRFAQAVGTIFAVVGTVGFAAGWTVLGLVATAFALAAAFLNAAFGFCLGCELYLVFRRTTARPSGISPSDAPTNGASSSIRRGVQA
jgi:disulfide bond formation protein DsbB